MLFPLQIRKVFHPSELHIVSEVITLLPSKVIISKPSTFSLMGFQGNHHALQVACKRLGLGQEQCWVTAPARETHLAAVERHFFVAWPLE